MSRQRSLIFWPIPLRKDREHSWKHHARSGSLLYELLGWIDVMAAKKEAETGVRFVFAKRETLLAKCFKGKRSEQKNYISIRHLDRVLAELREQHIISKYREMADGSMIFVVAPHDSLCRGDGKTCLLVDRSAWRFVNEQPSWRKKVLDALKKTASGQSLGQHQDSDSDSIRTVIRAASPAIEDSHKDSHKDSGQSLYDVNFALLTDQEKADWLANGMQDGSPTRVTRLAEAPADPSNPSYPSAQDELKHHEHFLKSKQRQQQEQPQRQERVSEVFSSVEPTTAEAKPKAKQPGRKRDVLPPDEYIHAQTAHSLAEDKAESERWRKENGYEECGDGIKRLESDRNLFGFTTKDANGIWQHPAGWQPSEELKRWEAERAFKRRRGEKL